MLDQGHVLATNMHNCDNDNTVFKAKSNKSQRRDKRIEEETFYGVLLDDFCGPRVYHVGDEKTCVYTLNYLIQS